MPEALGLFQHALLLAFRISLVMVLAAACAGIATSIVLSAFQIQDQTLPFAVKLVVICATLAVAGQSIGSRLLDIVDLIFALVASPRAGG